MRGPTPSRCCHLGGAEGGGVGEPVPQGPDGGLPLPRFRIKWAGPSAQPCVGMRTLER